MTELMEKLGKLAQERLGVQTLETRNRDNLDFYDIAIWEIRAALYQAYLLGYKDAEKNAVTAMKESRPIG